MGPHIIILAGLELKGLTAFTLLVHKLSCLPTLDFYNVYTPIFIYVFLTLIHFFFLNCVCWGLVEVKDNLVELVLSFNDVDFRDEIQVVRLGNRCL